MSKLLATELKKAFECILQKAIYPTSNKNAEVVRAFNSKFFDIGAKASEPTTGPAISEHAIKNQASIKDVVVNGTVVEVYYDSSTCDAFTSTNETQALLGDKKWLGLLLNLGLAVTDVSYSGSALSSGDAEEGASVGGDGEKDIVLYVYEGQSKTFYLEATGKEKTTYTIKLIDISAE